MKKILIALFLFSPLLLLAQYPTGTNKSRLGYQTTGDGLIWRGVAADTAIKPRTTANAYFQLDTVNGILRRYIATRGSWQTVSGGGGAGLTMPFDSITFNATTADPDTAELKYNADLETFWFGADGTTIEIGQKEAWYVKNQSGSTINKGTVVRAAGTLGSSGRILIEPMEIDGTVNSKYLLGITASNIANGLDGYVIHFGKLRKFNTSAWSDGAVLYAAAAGGLTATEPNPPNLRLPIAFVVHSHATNGVLAVRIQTGNMLDELHDVDTTGIASGGTLVWDEALSKWKAAPPDYDRDSTNEIQTLSFAQPNLFISDGNSVDLSPLLNGYVSGTGTANLLPKWQSTTTLTNSNLQDNGTAVSILNNKPFLLGQWTTAGRPTGVNGYGGFNTSTNWVEYYSSSGWFSPLQSSLTGGLGTSGSVVFLDANGRATQDNTKLFYNNTSNVFRVKGNASTATSTFDPSASNILKLELMADSNTDNAGGAIVWGGNSNIGGAAIKYQLVSGVGAGGINFYTRQGLADASLTRQVTIDYTGLFTVEKNAILKGDVTMGRVRINNFNSGGPGIYGNITEGIQSNGTYQNSQAAIKLDFLLGNYDFQTAPVGTVNTTPTLTSRMYLTNTGFLRLGGTGTTNYQLDVQGTNAIGFPRGNTGTRPTWVTATSPMRFNTDTSAFEYATALGTWSLLATRAYARSLVSALPTTNIYTSNGSLTGNRTLHGAGYSLAFNANTTVRDSFTVGNLPLQIEDAEYVVTEKNGVLGKVKFLIQDPATNLFESYNYSGFGFDTINYRIGYQASSSKGGGFVYSDSTGVNITGGYHTNGSIAVDQTIAKYNDQFKRLIIERPTGQYLKIFYLANGISHEFSTGGFVERIDSIGTKTFGQYGSISKTATALGKTFSTLAGFATDGTVLNVERKRDTTVYVVDTDLDWSAAITTAQIASRYNRVIFLMTTTVAAGSNSDLTLHSPDINLMQVEYLIRSTDEAGGFTNTIQFGSNNAVDSGNTLVGSYTPSPGQGVGIRAGLRSGTYKYWYY